MRLTIAIIATLAIWFPLGAFIGSRYTLAPRPPGAFSLVGVEAPKENGGFLFVTRFSPYPELADTAEQPTRSPLQLFDIRDRGNGRFWHSKEALYFSTSDNTDPRSNGRQYSWTIGPARPDQPPD
jgi:hypothetical protein